MLRQDAHLPHKLSQYGRRRPTRYSNPVGREDVPGAVTNGTLTGNVLSWENPTTGLHNGPFNNPIIGYHLTRSDGVVFELAGIMTSYTDDTIPSPGYYWYEIVPYNSIGDGGSAIIHQGIIPPPMIYEEFNLFPLLTGRLPAVQTGKVPLQTMRVAWPRKHSFTGHHLLLASSA